ncbi:receptor like protein 26-like [Papaver somniferum]|uniref:receptor like protein 26-like n=1 Tax=Papaver somniferum TaxID=3469 RepID=UPI000E6FAC08|nr:receptor like protein 26-like [Papaver somniferum]
MGNITRLESSDLSQNKLSGEIPSELAQLSFLSVLNLSYNKLEGRIPSRPQFLTFLENSFEGTVGLCGPPMSKLCCNITDKFDLPREGLDSEDGFDWVLFAVSFFGFVVGASVVIGPQYFWKKGRDWANERINRILCNN